MELDYQQIIDIVAHLIIISLPISFIFGVAVKCVNLFMSLAFGKDKVSL